jgi:TM2 domain-containing membrane protein YozV
MTKEKNIDEIYCSSCGKIIKKEAEICPYCGIRQKEQNNSLKDKTVAGILAILLGGFGIHKFYLNEIPTGILYLVFCWTLVPGFMAFIEGIIYFTESDESFNQKYNK